MLSSLSTRLIVGIGVVGVFVGIGGGVTLGGGVGVCVFGGGVTLGGGVGVCVFGGGVVGVFGRVLAIAELVDSTGGGVSGSVSV